MSRLFQIVVTPHRVRHLIRTLSEGRYGRVQRVLVEVLVGGPELVLGPDLQELLFRVDANQREDG